ncbi:MAG: hypothetical protein Q9209_006079 [Squamulea sp. 1 TL-2023]
MATTSSAQTRYRPNHTFSTQLCTYNFHEPSPSRACLYILKKDRSEWNRLRRITAALRNIHHQISALLPRRTQHYYQQVHGLYYQISAIIPRLPQQDFQNLHDTWELSEAEYLWEVNMAKLEGKMKELLAEHEELVVLG